MKRATLILTCLLVLLAAWFFWPHSNQGKSPKAPGASASAAGATSSLSASNQVAKSSASATNHFEFRLTNTKKTLAQLIHDPHAILLQNAFIDTSASLADLHIPDKLKAKSDPKAYIVQAHGVITPAFRTVLTSAGAKIVSYIPNNAYLVNVTTNGANLLSGNSLVQAVIPYEPYYAVQSSLLERAVDNQPFPAGAAITVGFSGPDAAAAEREVVAAGYPMVGTPGNSPFGPQAKFIPQANVDWSQIAQIPGVQYLGKSYLRTRANDLSRVTMGISSDTVTSTNWLNLSGDNVLVEMNDSGVDYQHPDFAGGSSGSRVTGDNPFSLIDANGHGTHVAGIIMGNGAESSTVTVPPEGSVTNANYRGKAPSADLYSVGNIFGEDIPDQYLQEQPAMTNALISNNSWVYGGDYDYDLAAASYDAATRDAIPTTGGAQPVLFVFSSGDAGGGSSDGTGGNGETIESPGTAKNVITVGALEQLRNITNLVSVVTYETNGTAITNTSAVWQPETDSGSEVADYSSRGNVGIQLEGPYGRIKPDVVAPGSFVVSTSSQFNNEWDTNAYYNPTNYNLVLNDIGQIVTTNTINYYNIPIPPNAISVSVLLSSNQDTPLFPSNLVIYAQISGLPDPVNNSGAIDITTSNDVLNIPPTTGGNITGIQSLQNGGFYIGVADSTNVPVEYNISVVVATTNNDGNYWQVLEGMNNSMSPQGFYRYESGTSMAAPAVSGLLALIQDFFTNTLHEVPSPALMKAMLINGARLTDDNDYSLTNAVDLEGWGLPNIQNILPIPSLDPTNLTFGTESPLFFVDQSVTNALATGSKHTYLININSDPDLFAQYLPLRATLVWTDPPGDPAAAIKLVNNLTLVITNLDTGEVFYGNDIQPGLGYNLPWNTNSPPNIDTINNVQNILLAPAFELLATNYSVTVIGQDVNVNAVTEQNTNVVQDYALVVSVGEGEVPNPIVSVTDKGGSYNSVSNQLVTYVGTTNSVLFNQMVGANPPLQGTNAVPLGTNTIYGPNGALTIGLANQWHFYVITNTALDPAGRSSDVTNAAFLTYDAYELSVPRMGVYEEANPTNATRSEADIDMYVSTDSGLTNLDPVVISNCLAGGNNASAHFSGSSIGQTGDEYVYLTNTFHGQVFYVGIKSEDQMASEYDFIPIFTATPFSLLQPNGDQLVNGLLLPSYVPDGSPARPGITNVFALATYPMEIENVIVTNLNQHQNFGDLVGSLTFSGVSSVLNNHTGLGDTYNTTIPLVYDDSAHPEAGARHTDVPGDLMAFQTKSVPGAFILNEIDNSPGKTGQVSVLNFLIVPHRNIKQPGITVSIPPGGWFVDYVTVPPGYTNLTINATNLPPTIQPPLQMYEKFDAEPTATFYDYQATLTNCLPGSGAYPNGDDPGNSISVGPPLAIGNYFVGIYNPSTSQTATVFIEAVLGYDAAANQQFDYSSSGGPQTLLNDGVTNSASLFVSSTQQIASVSVGMVVNSPQIADMTFTLVSPTGQRILLMENRGGGTTNGAGTEFVYTNVLNSTANGGAAPSTNYLTVSSAGENIPITYDFFTAPDEMTVYEGTNAADFNTSSPQLLLDTGFINGQGTLAVTTQPGYTNVTIIMNQFGNPSATNGDAWQYTAGAPITNYQYLVFTDDTNLADVPIKYAVPPYNFTEGVTNFALGDFDSVSNGFYFGQTNFGQWIVPTNYVTYTTNFDLDVTNFVTVTNILILTNNYVSVVTDPENAVGNGTSSNYLALAKGTVVQNIPTIPGNRYNITFWYRGPGISAWWRGEGNATDSSDPENNGNNGYLIGQFNFPAGEVGQAFEFENFGGQFAFGGTNSYVQVPQSTTLDVGKGSGFTVEGWINPTNLSAPQPVLEWLAHVPTNSLASNSLTNIVITAGPYLNMANGHYYYLLGATDWITSEQWATALGGHLATVINANEQNWIYDVFAGLRGANRNLWIGLTNSSGSTFGWSSGSTDFAYANWAASQPDNTCNTGIPYYTGILGTTNAQRGLWVLAGDNGVACTMTGTNRFYGVVEVNGIQTNGVRFWISATNTPGTANADFVTSNGCLYANIVDTNFVSHEIYSAPGLLQSNVFQYVALTYDTNSGVAMLYLNGTNVATTNFNVGLMPKTDGDVLLGRDMTPYTNNTFGGLMDEMSVYHRALSPAEILAIYQCSALTTNHTAGKFDPSITPAYGLAEAVVDFGGNTNVIYGLNNQWQLNSYTFVATTTNMPLRITGLEPGILLDDFTLAETPVTNLYYLPEQTLDDLTGGSAYGNWTLQVWDNLTGQQVTDLSQLISWQLSFILQSNSVYTASLPPEAPGTNTIAAGQTAYYLVNVPSWAQEATNVLLSATLPVDLYFNPTALPNGGTGPGDITLLSGVTSGYSQSIAVNTNAPYLPYQAGSSYILAVKNPNNQPTTVALQVDYNITALTNAVPYTNSLGTNDSIRYFSYTVGTNAFEATFQLLQLSGNADLVVSKGTPLPTLTNADYGSFNNGRANENIYVLTNSTPVPVSPGTWYIGVVKRDSGVVNYTVLAQELNVTNGLLTNALSIIPLANGVPVTWTAGPGADLTNFFVFTLTNPVVNGVTSYVPGVHFELYGLSGNGDLTVQTNIPPLAPPFFQTSQSPGNNPESIMVFTNSSLTNLAANWYLGVPNNESHPITYTIVAWIETNSYFPSFPGATGSGGGAVGGGHLGNTNNTVYHVTSTADSGPSTLRDAVSAPYRTVVFDVPGFIGLQTPLVITNSYLTIAGQTAPGGGVTVSGNVTVVTNAHDVVIRDVRFRPAGDVVWENGFDGYPAFVIFATGSHFANGWAVTSGDIELRPINQSYGGIPYQGQDFIDLNGYNPGTIVTNVATVAGQQYTLNFAYARNPDSVSLDPSTPSCNVEINGIIMTNFVMTNLNTWPNLGWAYANIPFTASSSSTAISFVSTAGGVSGVLLDAVSLMLDNGAGDSLDFLNVSNVLADHISASWSTNNLVAVLNSTNVTMQWSILSDIFLPTNNLTGGNGSLLRYGSGDLSFNHDLYANNYNSSPRLGDNLTLDFVDNVLYNWGVQSGYSDTNDLLVDTNGFTNQLNYSCNYLIAGPNTAFYATNLAITNIAFVSGSTNTWIFQTNNFIDSNTNGILDGVNTRWAMFTNQFIEFSQPFPVIPVPTDEAFLAYEKVLDFAGVNLDKRDLADTNIVFGVRSQNGVIVNSPIPVPIWGPSYPYLDTDQDGIPDFWENTFAVGGQTKTFIPNNNDASTVDLGYTVLEEYNNWLANPHALTVTTNPVEIDLQQMFGGTGHLSFYLTNSIHGVVYLTNVVMGTYGPYTNVSTYSNTYAVFTPTNSTGSVTNYSGYASFDVYVTNNDTVAYFGPETVSVVASAKPVAINSNIPPVIIVLGSPAVVQGNVQIPGPEGAGINLQYANTNYGGSDYYEFTVTNNSAGQGPVAIYFTVTNASGPVDLVVKYGLPLPSLSSYDYISTNSWTTSENIVVVSNSVPVPVTNGDWYLAVVNVSGSNVSYTINANEIFGSQPPAFLTPTNAQQYNAIQTIPFTLTCVATDYDIPPQPLTFNLVSGPTNMTVTPAGILDWTPTIQQGPTFNGPATNSILVSVSNGSYAVTNNFTIIVLGTNIAPTLPVIPTQVVVLTNTMVVANTGSNYNQPDYPLTYTLTAAPAGAFIDINGIITWPTTAAVANTEYLFTTVVTDTNPYAVNATSLSATNSFYALPEYGVSPSQPRTNSVPAGGIEWIAVPVPTNAITATNILLFATNLPVNVWYSSNLPPTITTTNDQILLPGATNGISILGLNGRPAIVPGGYYFLGIQNTNALAINYAVDVNFSYVTASSPINLTIVYTNIDDVNGFMLTWYAPSNDLFQVQWSTALVPVDWNSFPGFISFDPDAYGYPFYTKFDYFDNGSQTGGFGATRFYRVLLVNPLSSTNNSLSLPTQSNLVVAASVPMVVTNTATDTNTSATLSYHLVAPPAGASISSQGVITWTPPASATNTTVTFTTIASVNGAPTVTATNAFNVTVISAPVFTSVAESSSKGTTLEWQALSTEQFRVTWATNLAPPIVWHSFSNTVSSANGTFTFTDTNLPSVAKFYRLEMLP